MKKSENGLGMHEDVRESRGKNGQGDDLYGLPENTDGVQRNTYVAERVGQYLAVLSGQISTGGDKRTASAASFALNAIHAGIPAHTNNTKFGWVKLDDFVSVRRKKANLVVVRNAQSVAA